MRVINKQNLYPIFFLSGILFLVLFYSGFSFQNEVEGLTGETTVPLEVSPVTAAIVSKALDSIVQMGFSAIKTTNTVVKSMDTAVKHMEANGTAPVVLNSTSPQTTWVHTPTTSTSQ